MRLGFARGTAPSKWAERWHQATGSPLELVPIEVAFGRGTAGDPGAPHQVDAMIERTMPDERPIGARDPEPDRHAIALYRERIALVVAKDHELAEQGRISLEDLSLVRLFDHAHHSPEWPAAEPWDDPSWKPADVRAALDLVATGAGAILMPQPLARHLSTKREHVVLPIGADADPETAEQLPGTIVWATWSLDRDASDVQQLAGIMRGRTARSSRGTTDAEPAPQPRTQKATPPKKKQQDLKPGSRGAQLAAAREKAERAKAAKRSAKRRKRR